MELDFESTENITKAIFGDRIPTQEEQEAAISAIKGIIRYKLMHTNVSGDSIDIPSLIEDAKSLYPVLLETNAFIINRFPHFTLNEAGIVTSLTVLSYIKETDKKQNSIIDYINSISDKIEVFIEVLRERTPKEDRTPQSVTTNDVVKLIYPIDRVNRKIWDLQEIISNEELKIGMESDEDEKKGKQINLYFTFDFDQIEKEIEAVNRLIPYDKRVYIAVSGEFEAGNHTTSLTNIYRSMGYTGRPGATDLERISDSLTKMSLIQITVDNKEEARVYNYPRFRYKGQMLPIERIEAIVDGNILDASVHLFREPPLYTFAKERNHISTIEIDVLQSPISKTESNLMLEDYILDRFLKARHGNANPRVLYTTLHKHLSIDKTTSAGKKAIARLPDKVTKLLDHYVNTGFISGYSTDTRGIKASFRQEVQEKKEKKKTRKTVKQ